MNTKVLYFDMLLFPGSRILMGQIMSVINLKESSKQIRWRINNQQSEKNPIHFLSFLFLIYFASSLN